MFIINFSLWEGGYYDIYKTDYPYKVEILIYEKFYKTDEDIYYCKIIINETIIFWLEMNLKNKFIYYVVDDILNFELKIWFYFKDKGFIEQVYNKSFFLQYSLEKNQAN